ncbi:hypothetical protein ES708_25183 [subsurface metagenome]
MFLLSVGQCDRFIDLCNPSVDTLLECVGTPLFHLIGRQNFFHSLSRRTAETASTSTSTCVGVDFQDRCFLCGCECDRVPDLLNPAFGGGSLELLCCHRGRQNQRYRNGENETGENDVSIHTILLSVKKRLRYGEHTFRIL